MSYFDGDSDDNKKYGGSDDEQDSSSDEESVVSEEVDEDELLEDEPINEDEEEDEDSDIEEDDNDLLQDGGEEKKRTKKIQGKQKPVTQNIIIEDIDDTDDDENGEQYLQKFDKEINENYLVNFHPECVSHNYDEVVAMTKVIRDENGIIIDELHKTIPFLTKFEKARILGQRAKQINSGASPFVKVPENVIDGYLIAELELKQKRIPFIIRRPLPNGGSEYWSLKDLEDISF